MGRLTKPQATDHLRACDLVASDKPLTVDQKEFVLEHWRESSDAASSLDGAFFTPMGLARDISHDVDGMRIIDLCAGTGRLAFACRDPLGWWSDQPGRQIVCVERNPTFVAVGKRVLPEADWITADVTQLAGLDLGRFDCALANPPFNRTPRAGNGPRYRGPHTHFHVIDVAADLARRGVFIIPQTSSPFILSGQHGTTDQNPPEYLRFVAETGLELRSCMSLDTAYYAGDWHDTAPAVEVVNVEFTERRTPTVAAASPRRSHSSGSGQLAMFVTGSTAA